MRRSTIYLLACFLLLASALRSQDEAIELTNPSFESKPMEGSIGGLMPAGWFDCGFPQESAPDVHPIEGGGAFQVTKQPFHGKSYIGMVVREHDTWEMVSQRLSTPLKSGKCYEFSMYLCRSELYVSSSRKSGEPKNYVNHTKLRIWGGNGYCDRAELLAESPLIENTVWLPFDFRFEPKRTYTYIVLEAFYATPVLFPYNGNILLDNASSIQPIPCREPLLADNSAKKPKDGVKVKNRTDKPSKDTVAGKRIIKELERSKLTKGQVIRIEQIQFQPDSYKIVDTSTEVLVEIFNFLHSNRDVVIEIGGHTNALPEDDYCDRLSKERAQAVVDYLKNKGIDSEQLTFKGYGKRRPVAPNNTEEGRRKNQRVEIKIMSIGG